MHFRDCHCPICGEHTGAYLPMRIKLMSNGEYNPDYGKIFELSITPCEKHTEIFKKLEEYSMAGYKLAKTNKWIKEE